MPLHEFFPRPDEVVAVTDRASIIHKVDFHDPEELCRNNHNNMSLLVDWLRLPFRIFDPSKVEICRVCWPVAMGKEAYVSLDQATGLFHRADQNSRACRCPRPMEVKSPIGVEWRYLDKSVVRPCPACW